MKSFSLASCVVGLLVLSSEISPAHADTEGYDRFSDVGAVAVPLAAGALALWKDDTQGAVQLGLTWGAAVGTTWALKKAVDTTRPNGKPESFPSRHTASAFAGASWLHYRYGWKTAAPAYVVATGVAWARVEADEHYWKDVAVGAALANLSAWLLTSRYEAPVRVTLSYDPTLRVYEVRTGFRF
jgi:membrane-associated phospholipid phosphatase